MLAIVSGRDADFLDPIFPGDRVLLIGNHGLEERRDGESHLIPAALPYAGVVGTVAESAEALVAAGPPGAAVERKRVTVAVHVRRARDPDGAARWLRPRLAELASNNGLALWEGRLVFELRPPINVDKGQVIDRLLAASGARAGLFVGDDRTDADAFSALRRWRAKGLETIAVAVRSVEAPPELFADADLVVEGVPGVVALLRDLAADRS